MELYKEILIQALSQCGVEVVFTNLQFSPREIIELECYKVLQKIKAVIEDDSLEDPECFYKIEEIVTIFEKMGSDGGVRHDFG